MYRYRLRVKVYDQTVTVAFVHVISFIIHEKETATEIYLEPSETYMIELFNESH